MNKMLNTAACLLAGLATAAHAEKVLVNLTGVVEFNQIRNGELGEMQTDDQVVISFEVDSNDFIDGSFATRGYVIDESSFRFTAGSAELPLGPQPGTPYFVVRNDDPAVDGFFLSYGPDWPTGVELDQQGAFGPFVAVQEVTYHGSRLDSLDILDAIGTYSFGYQSFYFGVLDGPIDAAGFILHTVEISLVPCAADCNEDGTVNTLDVLCFLNLWNAGDSSADCNEDGTINTLDVLCFLNLWNAGC